jgi:hypothetical protein
MIYETLENGMVLTGETVDTLVADTYTAPESGAYKVIPNPHKTREPVSLSEQRRVELLKALSVSND